MREFNRDDFKNSEQRLDQLESNIYKEIADRVTESDATIDATQQNLNSKPSINN